MGPRFNASSERQLVILVEERGIELATPGLTMQRVTTEPLSRSYTTLLYDH